MAFGVPAFALITVALDQGVRLDWFNSPLIVVSLVAGLTLLGAYLLTEWYHPAPFIKLQMLSRRNLALGFTLFICLLVVLNSGVMLPMTYLGPLQSYRPLQMAPIGLIVALPRSEEHTSELQSLMRISYAVFCLKKKTQHVIN